jgi:hypothetical protein
MKADHERVSKGAEQRHVSAVAAYQAHTDALQLLTRKNAAARVQLSWLESRSSNSLAGKPGAPGIATGSLVSARVCRLLEAALL